MIEIKNLKSGYGNKNILDISSMIFNEGEITGIVGLNGSGKSTLLKSIVGLNDWTGEISADKKSIGKLNHKNRAKLISYLPQINPTGIMDVQTLVSHGRFPYLGFSKVPGQKDIELIENALSLCDLQGKRDSLLSEISGGERQRAYLAMVIAQNTKMILLDEPASYMDIKHQIQIMDVLKKLKEQGRGIVMTSHDLPQGFTFCDKIYLMENGRAVACGKPEELVDRQDLIKKVMNVNLQRDLNPKALYSFSLAK